LSIDKNDRHRGSDEGDAPLLGDGDVAPGDGEVVIGGEEGDQGERNVALACVMRRVLHLRSLIAAENMLIFNAKNASD
jgi:hypothetical protein